MVEDAMANAALPECSGVTLIDLSGTLNTADLTRLFSRSPLTILLWRKNKNLPYIRIKGEKRDTIRYDRAKVEEWAKQQGLRIHL